MQRLFMKKTRIFLLTSVYLLGSITNLFCFRTEEQIKKDIQKRNKAWNKPKPKMSKEEREAKRKEQAVKDIARSLPRSRSEENQASKTMSIDDFIDRDNELYQRHVRLPKKSPSAPTSQKTSPPRLRTTHRPSPAPIPHNLKGEQYQKLTKIHQIYASPTKRPQPRPTPTAHARPVRVKTPLFLRARRNSSRSDITEYSDLGSWTERSEGTINSFIE